MEMCSILAPIACVSGDTPEKGYEKNRILYARKIIDALTWAAELTGKQVHEVAGCISSATIRNYQIQEHNLANPLPPYHLRGNSLVNHFVERVGRCYKHYCEQEKATHLRVIGNFNTFLPHPSFETQLRPLLGNGIRFFLHHWHLHPNLSREENYTQGKIVLFREITPKKKPKHIIDEMVSERMKVHITSELARILVSEVELQGGHRYCFTASATKKAQQLIPLYLQTQNYKWPARKHALDQITDMQDFLCSLPADHDDRKRFGSIMSMVPRDTDEYESAQSVTHKKAKLENPAAKKEWVKQERETKLKSIHEALDSDAAGPAAEVTVGRKRGPPTDEVNEVKEVIKEFVWKDLPKLPIRNQTMHPTDIGSRERTSGEDNSLDHRRLIKYYNAMSMEKRFVEVSYDGAGEHFVNAIKRRFHNIAAVFNMMDEQKPILMADLFRKAQVEMKCAGMIPIQAMQTMVALFLEASGDVDEQGADVSDWPKVANLKRARCLDFQENICKDIKMLLLSTFFNKSVNHILILTAFGMLANQDQNFGGMNSASIWEEFNILLKENQRIPDGVASQFRWLKVVTLEVADKYLSAGQFVKSIRGQN